jgi:NAD+ kinase
MSSRTGSTTRRPEVKRVAVLTHGRPETSGEALARLRALAEERAVELVMPDEEVQKHGAGARGEIMGVDLAVVLGGDGTMLRALRRFLGSSVPVIGVNLGRVGFLSSMEAGALEEGLGRAFAGDYEVVELPALEASGGGGGPWPAVNDVVVASSTVGRMIELGWRIGGEDLGSLPCDGLICSTPTGSTAYNLSNGGPVLVWGIDAMAITFVAPHALHARPLVVPRGRVLSVVNQSPDLAATVLVDGQAVHELGPGDEAEARLSEQRSLLATLPESTFFSRYRRIFVAD